MKLKIEINKDGNMWCALVGENLQKGCSGFAELPVDAIRDLCNDLETQHAGLIELANQRE